ncbi:unnamed protein product [Caenorhabditis angaria]|uniref:SAM domain-containing protein n=1 Tax=Caenorhabditis angaria TaxID=860376 RepID=A0A9P1ITD9_9PELO|nr:unnamed protein product [Caenorhabditis angaria]
MDAWQQFFTRAGIPRDIASAYAKSFTTNRITKEMLCDLDKATLAELGVTAIGDQLLILKRIAAGAERNAEKDAERKIPQRARITAPTDVTQASHHRKGRPPPDRNEIYHVKMPVGSTARTQRILEKARKMRAEGLAVRGTTGVRQGGRAVSPIDKTSQAARGMRKARDFGEVSSSTDFLRGRIQKVGVSGRIGKHAETRMTGIRIQVKNDVRP